METTIIRTASDWLEELTKDQYDKAMANIEKQGMEKRLDWTYEKFTVMLQTVFDWTASDEGFEYWDNIYNQFIM